ncbi:MAG TPA: hypothetical protein VJ583_11435 [Nitrososphaeraceae archaeon]|nr:hypothetical protein [Nitrososphaeraceae archaeon]
MNTIYNENKKEGSKKEQKNKILLDNLKNEFTAPTVVIVVVVVY